MMREREEVEDGSVGKDCQGLATATTKKTKGDIRDDDDDNDDADNLLG